VNRPLTPRSVAGRRDWITATCSDLADALARQDRPELIAHFTKPLAYAAILDLFGSPPEHAPLCEHAARAFFRFRQSERKDGGAAYEAAVDYEHALVDLRTALEAHYPRVQGGGEATIIGSLLEAQASGDVSSDEVFGILRNFFAAGQENLIYTIAVAIMELLRHPEQLALVRESSQWATSAYEEAVRWEPPNQANTRRATVEAEVGGQTILPGDTLLLLKGAANRDPDVWTDPDRFDVTRDQNEPGGGGLSFGQGIHFCVGAGLARLVGPAAIGTLVDRFPNLRLQHGWAPRWENEALRRKLTALPVVLAR
jgi:cytochrome P450